MLLNIDVMMDRKWIHDLGMISYQHQTEVNVKGTGSWRWYLGLAHHIALLDRMREQGEQL